MGVSRLRVQINRLTGRKTQMQGPYQSLERCRERHAVRRRKHDRLGFATKRNSRFQSNLRQTRVLDSSLSASLERLR